MASNKITTTDIATLATEYSEAEIAAHVDAFPKEEVPMLLARANPLKKAIAFIEKCGEQRILGEAILGLGEQWVDKDTGVIYTFSGAPGENDCKDPAAFAKALLAAGIPQTDVDRAIYPVLKVDYRVAKELAKRSVDAQEAFDDNVVRKPFGPPHLKEAK